MEKNKAQISGFAVTKKAPSPLKEVFSKKKILLAYLCRNDLQNGVQKLFLNKWVSRYLSLGDFRFRKIALHNKIINKAWSIKNQENSTHSFGDNHLTNHVIKFLQDGIKPWRVGALCTGYYFF